MPSHWTLKDLTPWYSTTQPMSADGPTQWHLTGSGAKSRFLSTGISVATNGELNIMFELALKFGHHYTDRRRHSNIITAQRIEDSTMCPLNYSVCKPVKEESTEFSITQWVTTQSMASSGMPQRKCQATKNLKLKHPITHHRQAWTRNKRILMTLVGQPQLHVSH